MQHRMKSPILLVLAVGSLIVSNATASQAQSLHIPPIREVRFTDRVSRTDSFTCVEQTVRVSVEEGHEAGVVVTALETTGWQADAAALMIVNAHLTDLVRLRSLYAECAGFFSLFLVFGGQNNSGGLDETRKRLLFQAGQAPRLRGGDDID